MKRIKILFVSILIILVMFVSISCSDKKDFESTTLSNDSIIENQNIVNEEIDMGNVDDSNDTSAVGGGASLLTPLGCYYPISITTIDKTNTNTKGCFVYDRKEEMNTIIYELYDMMEYDDHTYHKMLWYVVQGLELSREDIETYNDLVLEGYRLTEDQIDALLIEDESMASNALKSSYTLYSEADNNVYRISDLEKLTEAEFKALEFSTEDVQRFTAAIAESDEVTVSLSFVNEICEMAGIEPIEEEVAA